MDGFAREVLETTLKATRAGLKTLEEEIAAQSQALKEDQEHAQTMRDRIDSMDAALREGAQR